MVKLVYCKTQNPLGGTAEIAFQSLRHALKFIDSNRAGLLKNSAGYSIYTVVADGELPETLFNFTR